MLSKVRSASLWLLCGVVPVMTLITLFSPVAASAADRWAAPADRQVTYVDRAHAVSQRDGRSDHSMRFQLHERSASIINSDASAVARTIRCHDCGAVAIAFQVVFAPAQGLTKINVNSTAKAISYRCVRCSTLAETVQIVYISATQRQLTHGQRVGLELVRREFEALQHSRLSIAQIQGKVAELADQAGALLQPGIAAPAPSSGAPSVSPDPHWTADPAQPTQINRPGIELYVKVQSA